MTKTDKIYVSEVISVVDTQTSLLRIVVSVLDVQFFYQSTIKKPYIKVGKNICKYEFAKEINFSIFGK